MIDRLSTLYELQLIDDLLDELEEERGDLPLAVNDLNNRIVDYWTQIETLTKEKEDSIQKRNDNDEEIVRMSENLKKFKSQLFQVRNNKEYDALTKEIDHSEEMINNLKNENTALEERVVQINIDIEIIEPEVQKLEEEKAIKEEELKKIINANEREEAKLKDKRAAAAKKVRKNDLNTYIRIRKALSGTAVATIVRTACSGCHNVVPPQRQIEIRGNRRLYTCESCGRLLISPTIAGDVETRFNK